jgi:hypothetical protein
LSYRSLGSVSDFGDSDVDVEEKGVRQGYTALGDDGGEDSDKKGEEWEDEDSGDEWEDVDEDDESDEKEMPTIKEVMDMAKRIFGKMPLPKDMDADHPLGFQSGASAFSSPSVFAAASSAVESNRKASMPEPESARIKSSIPNSKPTSNPKPEDIPPSSSLSSPSTLSAKPRVKEAEPSKSQPTTSHSATASSGPDPAMLERMRRLGSMAAMSDIQFGMERSAATTNSSTKAPERPVLGPPRPLPQQATSSDKDDMDSEGEDSDIPPFDLTRVLHSLQAVRGEIAGMDDEEERRKMAAKVALGFVYGMDMEGV